MADDKNKIVLQFELDRTKQRETLSAVENLKKSLEDIGGAAAKDTKAVQNLATAAAALKRQAAISDLVKQFADLAKSEEAAVESANELRKSLKDVGASKGEIADAVRSFNELTIARNKASGAGGGGGGKFSLGNAESLLSRAGSSLSGIGLGGVGGAVSGGADTLQLILSAKEGLAGLGATAGLLGGAAIAAAPAVIAVSKAVELFDKQTEMLTGGLSARVRTLDTYIKATTGTSTARLGAIGQNQQDISSLTRQRDELKKITDQTFNDLQKKEGDFGARIRLSRDKDYNDAIATIEKLNKQISDLQRTSNDAFKELQDGGAAAADAQEKQAQAARDLTKASLENAEAARQTALEQASLRSLTSDSAKQRLDSLKEEAGALQVAIKSLKDSGDTSTETADKIKEYEAALKKNAEVQKYLNDTALPLIKTREAEAEAVKQLNAQADARRAAIEREIEAEKQADKQRNDAIVSRYQQYEKDVKDTEQRGLEDRTNLQKRYNDNIVNIAKQAAEDSRKALEKLQQQESDLRTDYARSEATEQRKQAIENKQREVKAQREEAKAYEEQQRRLLDIRRSAANREAEFLLDRNFLGLFQSQQQTTNELEQANTEFVRGQQDRATAIKQESDDLTAQREFERNERLIAFQQRLADARVSYQRELQQLQESRVAALNLAKQSYNRDLTELNNKLTAELAMKRQAAIADLNLINQTEQQKLAIYVKALQDAMRFANLASQSAAREGPNAGNPITTVSHGQTIKRYAEGGAMQAGIPGMVNEPGSSGMEGYRANGQSIMFPGMGIFQPITSGTVTRGGGGLTLNQYITGNSPEVIAQIATQKAIQVVKEIVA